MERNLYEWYVVYTRQGMETKVTRELSKRNIECYCPVNKATGKWWTLGRKHAQPLFTSCVFVKLREKDVAELKKINGVVNVLYWLGRPAVVNDDEILMIKDFLCNHTEVSVERTTVRTMNYVYGTATTKPGYEQDHTAGKYKLELPTIGFRVVASKPAEVKVVSLQQKQGTAPLQHQYSNAG